VGFKSNREKIKQVFTQKRSQKKRNSKLYNMKTVCLIQTPRDVKVLVHKETRQNTDERAVI